MSGFAFSTMSNTISPYHICYTHFTGINYYTSLTLVHDCVYSSTYVLPSLFIVQ